ITPDCNFATSSMTKPEVVCCRARGEQLEGDIGPDHVKIRNIHNHYLQDREEQKSETFTGMGKHFLIHDSCATESMGTIVDRSKEHLGTSDIAVIAIRKFLLQCVKALDRGQEPRTLFGHRNKMISAMLPAW